MMKRAIKESVEYSKSKIFESEFGHGMTEIKKSFIAGVNSKYVKKLIIKSQINVLNELFQNGLGELDDNCSKDDLIENYHQIIKEKKRQLKEL